MTQESLNEIILNPEKKLKDIEEAIKRILSECEIWGDLPISRKSYKFLARRLKKAFPNRLANKDITGILEKRPLVLITDIIFFVKYDYDNNDFWNSWAKRFDIELGANYQTKVGAEVLHILEKHDKKIIEDGGYKYVTPIICQAGIPNVCFDKLFDILDNKSNSFHFDFNEFYNEIVGFTYKSYYVDSSVERYFKFFPDKANELITQLRELFNSNINSKTIASGIIPEFGELEPRIIKQYILWDKHTRENKTHKSSEYSSPKLVFDEIKGVCILLQGQSFRNSSSISKLKWELICDSNTVTHDSKVYEDEANNKVYTYDEIIPIDFSSKYIIKLYKDIYDKEPVKQWEILGISKDNPILFFNEKGFLQLRKDLSRKGNIVIFDPNYTKIFEKHNIQELIPLNLVKNWSEKQSFNIYPALKIGRAHV